jgi:type IV pilus assembly protein PilE
MRNHNGFTLIEMLITVAIIAILAAIALPSYQRYVVRTARTEARSALTEIAARQERYRYSNPGYASTLAQLSFTNPITENGRYTISLAGGGATYTVTATPVSGTSQSADTCAALSVTHAGVKASGNGDPGCWK